MAVLDGKVILVTGAGRGIGRAIAERLSREGAKLVVNDVDRAPAMDVAEAVGGVDVVGSVVDPDVAREAVKVAVERWGGLDAVVNNAGIAHDALVHRMTDSEWSDVVDTCLRGTFNFVRAAAPAFRQRLLDGAPGHRKVVNIASINGIYGAAGNSNYSAAKAGVIGFSKAVARELAPIRVNVNVVAPGFIAGTRLSTPSDEGGELRLPSAVVDTMKESIPIGRPGTPEDVAGVVLFLCSADSDFVTGQVIEVHGGREIINVPR